MKELAKKNSRYVNFMVSDSQRAAEILRKEFPLPLPLPLPLPPLLPPASAVTALAMFFVAASVALMVAFLSDTVFSAAASVFLNAATRSAE